MNQRHSQNIFSKVTTRVISRASRAFFNFHVYSRHFWRSTYCACAGAFFIYHLFTLTITVLRRDCMRRSNNEKFITFSRIMIDIWKDANWKRSSTSPKKENNIMPCFPAWIPRCAKHDYLRSSIEPKRRAMTLYPFVLPCSGTYQIRGTPKKD